MAWEDVEDACGTSEPHVIALSCVWSRLPRITNWERQSAGGLDRVVASSSKSAQHQIQGLQSSRHQQLGMQLEAEALHGISMLTRFMLLMHTPPSHSQLAVN